VLHSLSLPPVSFEKDTMVTRRSLDRQFIECQDLSATCKDSSTCRLGKFESTYGECRDIEKALIIDDLSNDNSYCLRIFVLKSEGETGN
jgi:hypothetical protein